MAGFPGAKYKGVNKEPMAPGRETAVLEQNPGIGLRFQQADRIVLGVPMWNFAYSYKLKQMIDLVCQRHMLFTYDGNEYGPLLKTPRAFVVYARGGTYMDNAKIDGLSRRMADTYNGSTLPVKFLTASGWGPLLNLGYFELRQLPSLIGGLNHFQRHLVNKSVDLLNPQADESILDLACGNGWTTQFIAQHGSKTTGIDLCEPHIKSAQSNFGKAGNVSFLQGDATHVENVATPNSIDKIHCLEAAFHFGPEGRKALLNSAFHVLKPGGTFVLVDITWRTDYPEQIDDVDPESRFRETWQMELFEPFETYKKNAKAIGFVERQILDWTKPVIRIFDLFALIGFMGQHSLTRKALEIARSEYSVITEHEWNLLLQKLRLSQRVLAQSRYAAYIFTKP